MHSTELIRCNISLQSYSIVNLHRQLKFMNNMLVIEMLNNFYTRGFDLNQLAQYP